MIYSPISTVEDLLSTLTFSTEEELIVRYSTEFLVGDLTWQEAGASFLTHDCDKAL
jgi:hypothetical protein